MSTRPQRLANAYRDMVDNAMAGLTDDPAQRTEEFNRILYDAIDAGTRGLKDPGASLKEYEKAYLAFAGSYDDKNPTKPDEDSVEQSFIDGMLEQNKAERRMGSDFVSFRVNFTSSNSDNFNNQSTEPTIKSEINAMSSKARMARFNLADGNLGGPIGTVVGIASDVVKGVLSAAQVSGFIALAGNAFADIQKLYESSSADLNRSTFTIPLRSWAADDWVRLKNLFIPLGAILALGLPRATGRSSYDGPPILELFNQGHTLIREGMVESITIERGVGDVGWAKGGKCLGIDVHITIVDLSTILSMPINPGFSSTSGVLSQGLSLLTGGVGAVTPGLTAAGGQSAGTTAAMALNMATYSEDNKYTDYLATLASLPLDTMINSTRKWQLNMARSRAEFNQWKSPARVASGLMDNFVGDFIKALSMPTDRP